MGNNPIKKQIIHYYLFHKKLELFFNFQCNPFYTNDNSKELKVEHFYVINKPLVKDFKKYCNYDLFKYHFDEINIEDSNYDMDKYKSQLEKKFDEINKELNLEKMNLNFVIENFVESKWCSKNILSLENFDNVLDEKAYGYFKDNIELNKKSEIKGTIMHDKIILFYKNYYLMKFLYYGELEESNGQKNCQLIQLTADFFKFSQRGDFDKNRTKEVYSIFEKNCCENINYAFNLFDAHGIKFLREEKIIFNVLTMFNKSKSYSFKLKNENLSSRTLEQSYKKVSYQILNPKNFRLIGLENVGATCYMNATLQCFINVPTLTQYLLTDEIFKKITQNSHSYELSSAYCYLLFHVCCDEKVTKYFKPQEFKDVISWKNPLFKGVNANDSKDLINFLLEEMNQELIKLNPEINFNNYNLGNNFQLNQADKYSVLNHFKFNFAKNNNSIIAIP